MRTLFTTSLIMMTHFQTPWFEFGGVFAVQENNKTAFVPGEDSYRVALELDSPRRYATRFDKSKRVLELRISPARSAEFEQLSFYDSRFIKRVFLKEEGSEVFISFQLKNFPQSWLVATQDNPWRIIVDFWKTEQDKPNLIQDWDWQENYVEGNSGGETQINAGTYPLVQEKKPQNTEVFVLPDEIKIFSDHKNSSDSKVFGTGKKSKKTNHHQIKNKLKLTRKKPQLYKDKKNTESVVELNKPIIGGFIKKENFLSQQYENKIYDLPKIFYRLEHINKLSREEKSLLENSVGTFFGSKNEFDSALKLANRLYESGQEESAIKIYRKLAAMNESKFKSDELALWHAGESSFLIKNFDLASDYLRTLLLYFPQGQYATKAQLRLTDINTIAAGYENTNKISDKNLAEYRQMAQGNFGSETVKILSSLRIIDQIIETNSNAAKEYQRNLDACANMEELPFDLKKICSYDRTRLSVEYDPVIEADSKVQLYAKIAPEDHRISRLNNMIYDRVKKMLAETNANKTWDVWVNFESRARLGLLEFTFSDPDSLFIRAKSFEFVGDIKKSIQIYESFISVSKDKKKKVEALINTALMHFHINDRKKGDELLKRLYAEEGSSSEGFAEKSMIALRELSLPPISNKHARQIVINELKMSRYVERDLLALSEWGKSENVSGASELIHEKILAYPARTQDEIQTVESSIMRYADDLRNSGRFAKAGDMFIAVASVQGGTKRSEAAYKAGVVYARAGVFEKAKNAWALAAGDTSDKRYSGLASERLDRLSK